MISDADLIAAGARRVERIGDAVLILGDCREIAPKLTRPDAIVSDPPYSVSVAGSKNTGPHGTRNLDFFAGDADWKGMTASVVERLSLCMDMRPSTFIAWCGHRQIGGIVEALETRGYSTRLLFWRKTCPPPSPPGAGFCSAVEQAVYGYVPGRHWGGGQYDANIFDCDGLRHGNPDKVDHPTQKPLALMSWNIEKTVSPGALCLDPYMGSGTTGVACIRRGVRFVGIEIEPRYFDTACRRVAEAARQPSLFDAAPAPKAEQRALDFPVQQMGPG
jgi:site-specific DNA-methyltransferase (adenine-specific)